MRDKLKVLTINYNRADSPVPAGRGLCCRAFRRALGEMRGERSFVHRGTIRIFADVRRGGGLGVVQERQRRRCSAYPYERGTYNSNECPACHAIVLIRKGTSEEIQALNAGS